MALDRARTSSSSDVWQALVAQVGSEGSASHAHVAYLSGRGAAPRDLADAAHLICGLHGRHPGLLDHAAEHRGVEGALGWLEASAAAFADERALLVQLAVAAGPMPSTPGQAESEATVAGQRHALDMLARSGRNGCSLGAALALVMDWTAINRILQVAGDRFGVEMPFPAFPGEYDSETLAATIAGAAAVERATMFGAEQLLAQHRGLFDLLEARAEARNRT